MENNNVLKQAFTWLFIGTIVCFLVSYLTTFNEKIALAIFGAFGGFGFLFYAIAEIVVALILIIRIKKMAPTTAKIFYILYTALTGLSLSGIFLQYTSESIAFVFLGTAVIFGTFAFIGYTTKVDLSKMWIYLFGSLIAILVLELINIFLMNNTLNMVLCIAGVVIFAGYTAYDIRQAANLNNNHPFANAGIYCAFQLFLDIINIFIRLLELFGRERN